MQEGHPHNPKRNKRLDAVFFNTKRSVVSLKRRTITIELNRRAFTALYRRSALVAVLVLVCAGILGAGYVRQTRAETKLYPHTCLGGWNNSARAQGAPDLDGTDYSAYNDSNSASISNALSEIYCGQFAGDAPPDTVPAKITLKLSWAVRKTPAPTIITSGSFASSTNEILNAPATTTALIIVEATSTPSSDTASKAPTSTPNAQLQEAPQDAAPAQPDTLAPQPSATSSPSDARPQSFIETLAHLFAEAITPPVYAQTADVASSSATSSIAVSQELPDGIVEILYTLDGTTWHSIAVVPAASFSSASFDLPVETIKTWKDISKLQIEVRTLSSANPATTIYLDGMEIRVAYNTTAQVPSSSATSTTLFLTNGAAFRESDLPDVTVHPVWNDGSTNIIFYQRYDAGATTYMAETRGHGDVALANYYAPLPPVGAYSMVEYVNDDGAFECNGVSIGECVSDPHFIALRVLYHSGSRRG